MKKFFLVTLALSSTMAIADVDYSRCATSAFIQLDHDGHIQPGYSQTIKSQRTVGNRETVVLESTLGNKKFQQEIALERDAQGRITKIVTGGDRPSAQSLQQYRQMMIDGNVSMAGMQSGFSQHGNQYSANFMAQEPTFWLRKTPAAGGTTGSTAPVNNMYGGIGDFEMIPLSRLTTEQAAQVGIENPEELRRLRQQWRQDRRTSQRLRSGYEKVMARSSLVVPLGTEAEVEVVDGVCTPKSVSTRLYNSQTNQVTNMLQSSRERCEKIQSVFRRHERKINECQEEGRSVTNDYYQEVFAPEMRAMAGGTETGSTTGGTHGAANAGGMYLAGGIAGGGLAGGIGMGGGMYPGGMGMYGMGYPGMYNMLGLDMNSVQMQHQQCQWIYGTGSGPSLTPTPSEGSSGSSVQNQ